MRLLAVNHSHPATPHVSGICVSAFADALARDGHRIVLITSTLNGAGAFKAADRVAREIRDHDCAGPIISLARRAGTRSWPGWERAGSRPSSANRWF